MLKSSKTRFNKAAILKIPSFAQKRAQRVAFAQFQLLGAFANISHASTQLQLLLKEADRKEAEAIVDILNSLNSLRVSISQARDDVKASSSVLTAMHKSKKISKS